MKIQATGNLGTLRLRNRLVVAPMVTLFAFEADRPTQAHLQFYRRLAESGAGAMVVGAVAVSRQGKGFPSQIIADKDEKIDDLRSFRAGIQKIPTIVQLFHAGPKTNRRITGSDVVSVIAESPQKLRYDQARRLSDQEVETIIHDFVSAATRIAKAGFRGVELHGANGYLLHRFSDPRTNLRQDRWKHRNEVISRIVSGIRACVPSEFIIGYTFSPFYADDLIGNHLYSPNQMIESARSFEALGVDYLHIYRKKEESAGRLSHLSVASVLKMGKVSLPIIEGSGIDSVQKAAVQLSKGPDFVACGRALLLHSKLPMHADGKCIVAQLNNLSSSAYLRRWFSTRYGPKPVPLNKKELSSPTKLSRSGRHVLLE